MPSLLLLLAACSIQPRAVSGEQVIRQGDARLTLPQGAVPPGVEVRMRSLGDPADHGLTIEGDILSELWVLEPVGLVLNAPATLEIAVDASAPPTVHLQIDGSLEPVETTWTDGLAGTTITQLAPLIVTNSVIVPVDPGSPTPPPTNPTAPTTASLPPLASHPSPGDIWSCGTGADDVLDLTAFDDTAVPAPATVASCGAGTIAHTDGVAYADLGSAIDAASAGSVVEICPGVHEGRYLVPGDVTLRGHADDPAATVLTAALTGPVLTPTGPLTLERLTLRRGYASYSGGGLSTNDTFTAVDTIWEQNTACYEGGALDATGSVDVVDAHFEGNLAAYGAGATTVGIRWDPSDVRFQGSTFVANKAGYDGGAMKVDGDGGAIHLIDCHFENNQASYNGGALVNGSWDSHLLSVQESSFVANHAGYEGGAIDAATWSPDDQVEIIDTTFSANTAPSASTINISHHEGGSYDFVRVTIDGANPCEVDVGGTINRTSLFEVDFTDSTVDPGQICHGNRAVVTIDGAPLLP